MANRAIGIGIIGASTQNPGWAMLAHIPAIEALPEFQLQAVSTSNSRSAAASAAALGVPAFNSAEALIAHGNVDLVVVAVKVPDHRVLTAAALQAGKMVFTEWPLGRTYQEAEDLAERAKRSGLRTVIGLQARFSPAVQRARQLVTEGYIGDVIATTLTGTGMIWGSAIPRSFAYTLDIENGAGVLPVPTMHGLDALTYVLGDFATISAEAAIRRSHVRIIEDGSIRDATALDHVAIAGRLKSGAIATVQFRGAASRGDNLRWEIIGSLGDLVLTASNGNLQVADVHLAGGRGNATTVNSIPTVTQPEVSAAPVSGVGANTFRLYEALAFDLRRGTAVAPDFCQALALHKLLAAIEEAIKSGTRQPVT